MSDEAKKALRNFAAEVEATASESLELSSAADGAITLLEACDANGRARIILPTTQVPQVAATLLQFWQRTKPEIAPQMLDADLPSLTPGMVFAGIKASNTAAAPLPGGDIRLGFAISDVPLCIELSAEQALTLVEKILAVIEADPSAPNPKQ